MSTYTVKKGDTLSDLAKRYGTTYQDIAKANGITNPHMIEVGQVLQIGGNTANQKPAATATAPTTSTVQQDVSGNPFQVSSSTAAANQNRQTVAAQKPGPFTYGAYVKSDTVKQAEALLQQQLASKPNAYQSQWQTGMNEVMSKITGREPFSYDLNEDALYQQLKDQYVLLGQQASMDTMGQAQAMTGGYGNSYAQSVGQQAYQAQLQQLHDRAPELYQLALAQHNQEGQELYKNL